MSKIEIEGFILKIFVKNRRNVEKRGRKKNYGEVKKREEKSSLKYW